MTLLRGEEEEVITSCGKRLSDISERIHKWLSACSFTRVGGATRSNSDTLSLWQIVKGAMLSEVFWGINLMLLLITGYPVAYLSLILFSEGTWLKPILLAGLYLQCGLGATLIGYREYVQSLK